MEHAAYVDGTVQQISVRDPGTALRRAPPPGPRLLRLLFMYPYPSRAGLRRYDAATCWGRRTRRINQAVSALVVLVLVLVGARWLLSV